MIEGVAQRSGVLIVRANLRNRRDRQGQLQDFQVGPGRPGGLGGSQDRGDLVVVERWDDGRDRHPDRHAWFLLVPRLLGLRRL